MMEAALQTELARIAALWIAGAVLMIPLLGVTARWGLRPLVDAVARLRQTRRDERTDRLEARVASLSRAVEQLGAALDRERAPAGRS